MRTAVSTPITSSKRGRRNASEWRALMRGFSQGGETRTQFCRRHGVALSTFDWWRRRLRSEPTPRAVANTTPPQEAGVLFVELTREQQPVAAVSAGWDVELELGRGVFVRLRRGAC